MGDRASVTVRSRGRNAAAAVCLVAGVVLFLFGYSGVDTSVGRYAAFVAGGALVVGGFVLLSLRSVAILAAVFVAAVAFEGPIPAAGAQALRVLDRSQIPRYQPTAKGFVGPTRDFPYQVFVGPPEAIGPFMVDLPARYQLEATTYSSKVGSFSSAVATGPTQILHHDGYTRIASWQGPREEGRICTLELEVAGDHFVSESLVTANQDLRSKLAGKAIVRLVASCATHPLPGPTPAGSSTPATQPPGGRQGGPG
jgi:hypothetical protein